VNGRLSLLFAAATTAVILVGVIIITTASSSFAQQGPIADGTDEQDQSTSQVSTTNATLSAKINQQFYITLSSNPSTGYEWQVASVSNPDMVRFVDSQYIHPESELLGAAGKQVLTFNALQEGNTTIQLEYVRPWETGVPPVSIYVAEVVVENGIQQ
jgi:inhibitor of cysteine peptidase